MSIFSVLPHQHYASKKASCQLRFSALFVLALFAIAANPSCANPIFGEAELEGLLEDMKSNILEFRDAIEEAYSRRCETEVIGACGQNNYDDCTSVYPNLLCTDPNELLIPECSGSTTMNGIDAIGTTTCNALWDKSVTVVSLPSSLVSSATKNPNDAEVVETICYSHQVESQMVDKYEQDIEYWSQWNNVSPAWRYFGAHNGVFRKLPATHSQQCGLFDPRRRPWYVAASSGPKDVVLVIDVSGSMQDYRRIELAIEAAKTVIETLTVADRVAVVLFSNDASALGGQTSLLRATKANKDFLIRSLSSVATQTSTNFYAGFETAFDILDTTISTEQTTGCNIAILFLTDGLISEGPGKDDVISMINQRSNAISEKWNRKTYVFTYSLGIAADHDVTKSIACATGGLWNPVEDESFGGDLVTAMANYYKLFAIGLGEGSNQDFTAWVEPYNDFTSGGIITTISAPVYNRNVTPPLFLGVVGEDIFMDALEEVTGDSATSTAMLNRFVRLSTAQCPTLTLTECELDALRYLGGGDEARCGACTDETFDESSIVPTSCRIESDYPRNVWQNNDLGGLPFAKRACCQVGEDFPSDTCPEIESMDDNLFQEEENDRDVVNANNRSGEKDGLGTGSIIAVVAAASIAFIALLYYFYSRNFRKSSNQAPQEAPIDNIGASNEKNLFPASAPFAAAETSAPAPSSVAPPFNSDNGRELPPPICPEYETKP